MLSLSTPLFDRYLFIVARLFLLLNVSLGSICAVDYALNAFLVLTQGALRLLRFILLIGDSIFWFLISYKIVSEQLDDLGVLFNVKLHLFRFELYKRAF